MAQDPVKKLDYFQLIEDDKLFGRAGRIIDSDVYEVLPEESKKKFKEPDLDPRKKKWGESGGIVSSLSALYGDNSSAPTGGNNHNPWYDLAHVDADEESEAIPYEEEEEDDDDF